MWGEWQGRPCDMISGKILVMQIFIMCPWVMCLLSYPQQFIVALRFPEQVPQIPHFSICRVFFPKEYWWEKIIRMCLRSAQVLAESFLVSLRFRKFLDLDPKYFISTSVRRWHDFFAPKCSRGSTPNPPFYSVLTIYLNKNIGPSPCQIPDPHLLSVVW